MSDVGKYFGRWLVIDLPVMNGRQYALVRCTCGTQHTVLFHNIKAGKSQSCGCLKNELTSQRSKKQPGQSGLNTLFSRYKRDAKVRQHSFDLNLEQFSKLTKQNCHYCGTEPSQLRRTASDNSQYTYNGIDRIDNMAGYSLDNCVSCCGICNRAKSNLSIMEFETWITRLTNHQHR